MPNTKKNTTITTSNIIDSQTDSQTSIDATVEKIIEAAKDAISVTQPQDSKGAEENISQVEKADCTVCTYDKDMQVIFEIKEREHTISDLQKDIFIVTAEIQNAKLQNMPNGDLVSECNISCTVDAHNLKSGEHSQLCHIFKDLKTTITNPEHPEKKAKECITEWFRGELEKRLTSQDQSGNAGHDSTDAKIDTPKLLGPRPYFEKSADAAMISVAKDPYIITDSASLENSYESGSNESELYESSSSDVSSTELDDTGPPPYQDVINETGTADETDGFRDFFSPKKNSDTDLEAKNEAALEAKNKPNDKTNKKTKLDYEDEQILERMYEMLTQAVGSGYNVTSRYTNKDTITVNAKAGLQIGDKVNIGGNVSVKTQKDHTFAISVSQPNTLPSTGAESHDDTQPSLQLEGANAEALHPTEKLVASQGV